MAHRLPRHPNNKIMEFETVYETEYGSKYIQRINFRQNFRRLNYEAMRKIRMVRMSGVCVVYVARPNVEVKAINNIEGTILPFRSF